MFSLKVQHYIGPVCLTANVGLCVGSSEWCFSWGLVRSWDWGMVRESGQESVSSCCQKGSLDQTSIDFLLFLEVYLLRQLEHLG